MVALATRLAAPPAAHPYREARWQACRIDVDDVPESLAIAHRRMEQDTLDVWVFWTIGLGDGGLSRRIQSLRPPSGAWMKS